ncbi:MAG: glycoside hydrolase family 3 protein [Elusimicrobia bacterium]|nr:glycoside hydrolase family 3 protein [Elusimicrobiota bacterium]
MSDGKKASQLVFPSFQFGRDDPGRAAALVRAGVGGFCLYKGTPRLISGLVARLQRLAEVPLLFCADYEDGAASHCQGATALPTNMGIGASGRPELARLKAEVTAREALALGVRWVLAPVADLALEPANPIVNVRSFGADPALVSRMVRAYLSGLRGQGVLGCLKHFPGHGRTVRDSHLELPVIKAGKAALENDLSPFRRSVREADSVMLGHLAVPALGSARGPFSLSPAAGRLLRGELGFAGLVATDALDMHAISKRWDETAAARRALRAGADVLLVPKDPERLLSGLRAQAARPAVKALVDAALARLLRAKTQAGLFADALPDRGLLPELGGPGHAALAQRLAESCLAWRGKPAALKDRRLVYAEAGGRGWRGRAFATELRRLGASLRLASGPARPGEILVLGLFLRPRAYSGRVALEPAELAAARDLARRFRETVVVSFGSPFALSGFSGLPGLCAFSDIPVCQRAAAKALVGAIPVTGRMPVDL